MKSDKTEWTNQHVSTLKGNKTGRKRQGRKRREKKKLRSFDRNVCHED